MAFDTAVGSQLFSTYFAPSQASTGFALIIELVLGQPRALHHHRRELAILVHRVEPSQDVSAKKPGLCDFLPAHHTLYFYSTASLVLCRIFRCDIQYRYGPTS